MPLESTVQTIMPLAPGTRAPGLDADDMIYQPSWKFRIANKTASWTADVRECGTIYTNTGAGGKVTCTLPAPSADNAGVNFWFFVTDNDGINLTCTDKICTFNNAAADGVEIATNVKAIGGAMMAVSNGSLWLVLLFTFDATDQPVTVISA